MERWRFGSYEIMGGSASVPTATVALKRGDTEARETVSIGSGPIEAAFNCIDRIAGQSGEVIEIKIELLKEGLRTVLLSAKLNGETFPGRGTSPDTTEAMARAYMDAHNRCIARRMERAEWI